MRKSHLPFEKTTQPELITSICSEIKRKVKLPDPIAIAALPPKSASDKVEMRGGEEGSGVSSLSVFLRIAIKVFVA